MTILTQLLPKISLRQVCFFVKWSLGIAARKQDKTQHLNYVNTSLPGQHGPGHEAAGAAEEGRHVVEGQPLNPEICLTDSRKLFQRLNKFHNNMSFYSN